MDSIALPAPLVQDIGTYLMERPYREVAALLGQMHAAVTAAKAAAEAPADLPKPE